MNNVSLISIIVPVYKVEQYLDRCVESVVNQTYKNLEIILVDDGSPDNCPKMCDEWAEKDSRIKVIHKENDGLANARNSGIEICSGDYVMFVDSDDWIEPDMVEFLCLLIVKNNSDCTRCGVFFDNDNLKNDTITKSISEHKTIIYSNQKAICDLLVEGHSGICCNKIYKKSAIGDLRFEKNDGCAEDFMFNYHFFQNMNSIVINDTPKYHYIMRIDSITKSDFSYGAFDIIKAKQFIISDSKGLPVINNAAIEGFIISAFIVLSGCIQNDTFENEQHSLINSILMYKRKVLFSKNLSIIIKLKTILLAFSKKNYSNLIKRKYKK